MTTLNTHLIGDGTSRCEICGDVRHYDKLRVIVLAGEDQRMACGTCLSAVADVADETQDWPDVAQVRAALGVSRG